MEGVWDVYDVRGVEMERTHVSLFSDVKISRRKKSLLIRIKKRKKYVKSKCVCN